MLVLRRKELETIRITNPNGTIIDVTVTRIQPGGVRLGFTMPPDVTVNRLEVQEAIDRDIREDCEAMETAWGEI